VRINIGALPGDENHVAEHCLRDDADGRGAINTGPPLDNAVNAAASASGGFMAWRHRSIKDAAA